MFSKTLILYWFANVWCNICYKYIHCYTTCFTTTKNKTISEYEYMIFLAFGPIAAQILVLPLYYWNIRYPYVIPFDSLIASLLSVYYFISPKYFTRYKKHRTIFCDTKLKNTIHTILIFLFWKITGFAWMICMNEIEMRFVEKKLK